MYTETNPKQRGGVSPQVQIRVAEEQTRSAVANRNAHPSWRERFSVALRKGSLQEGDPVLVVFQAFDASWKSALGGAGKGRDLGTGSLDILSLLNGARGSHVCGFWFPARIEQSFRVCLHLYTYIESKAHPFHLSPTLRHDA